VVKLKLVYVFADPTNVNNVVVTRLAANGVPLFAAAGDALAVLPGGGVPISGSGRRRRGHGEHG
jgi:hypothetical protein